MKGETHNIGLLPGGFCLLQKFAFCLQVQQLTSREGPYCLMRIACNKTSICLHDDNFGNNMNVYWNKLQRTCEK